MKNVASLDIFGQCTGCCACRNICPQGAVVIGKNERGFYVPEVTGDCADCGLCLSVCQICSKPPLHSLLGAAAGKNRDLGLRMRSSSGGLFSEICSLLSQRHRDSIVFYGVVWADDCHRAVHEKRTAAGVSDYCGSKYVQSYIGDAFSGIAEALLRESYVLFSGTPCQCAGLANFLRAKSISDERLYLIDVVCHGAASPGLWDEYITVLEKEHNEKIRHYSFRDKSVSWRGIHPVVETASGKRLEPDEMIMSYGKLFNNTSLNEKCYDCDYACTRRVGDLTLGDHWGMDNACKELDDGKGVSVCLINTPKGRALAEELFNTADMTAIEDESYLQPNLRQPTSRNLRQKKFWKDLEKHGYEYAAKKFTVHSRLSSALYKHYKNIKKR